MILINMHNLKEVIGYKLKSFLLIFTDEDETEFLVWKHV